MSELPAEVKTAINIAIAVAEGLAGGKVTADLIGDAIRLSHHKVVPAGGEPGSDEKSAARSVPSVVSGAQVPKPKPHIYPKLCKKCSKVINDRAAEDACDRSDCPI